MTEYANRALMRDLGSLQQTDFEKESGQYIPSLERINSVAPELNRKVQEARLALAAVALAVNGANQTIADVEHTALDKENHTARVAGIPKDILKYLDDLERNSTPAESNEYDLEAEAKVGRVLDQFDAIDDGTARRVMGRSLFIRTTAQSGYNVEDRRVEQKVLRKVGDVYDYEETSWDTHDFRRIAEAKSSTRHTYFGRMDDGSFSSVVSVHTDHDSAIVSPLISEASGLRPSRLTTVGYSLERFMESYIAQQRALTVIDLLQRLPVNRGWRTGSSYNRDTLYPPVTEYSFGEGDEELEVVAYAESKAGQDELPRQISFFRADGYEPEAWIDCDTWKIQTSKLYTGEPRGSSSIIEEVKAKLHDLVLEQSDVA